MSAVTSDAKRAMDIRGKWYCRMAIAALSVYVAQSILFSYSYLFFETQILKAEEMRPFFNAISFALCGLAILIKPSQPKRWHIVLIAIAFSAYIISASNTKMHTLLYGLLVLVAISDVSMEGICKWYGFVILVLSIVVVLVSLSIPDFTKGMVPNSRLVYSYGFQHPNLLGALLFSSIGALAFAYRRRRVIVLAVLLPLSLLSAVFSYVMLSAHAPVVLFGVLAVAIVLCCTPFRLSEIVMDRKLFAGSLVATSILLVAAMAISAVLFNPDNALLALFNRLVHARPAYAHAFYSDRGGFTLLGREYGVTDVYLTGLPMRQLDSGYCLLLLVYGVIPLVVYLTVFAVSMWRVPSRERTVFLWLIMLVSSAYLLVEREPMYPLFFTFLFYSYAFTTGPRMSLAASRDRCGPISTAGDGRLKQFGAEGSVRSQVGLVRGVEN